MLKDNLIKVYSSNFFQEFLKRNDRLIKYHSESYKEYFGFNILNGEAQNIKFYITYLRPLSEKELIQLIGFNPSDDFIKSFKKKSNNYDPKKGGTGTTIAFKYDTITNRITIGVYFLIRNSNGWNLNEFPFILNYREQTGKEIKLSSDFLLYYEFDTNNNFLNKRIHCYSKSIELFCFLEKEYNQTIQPHTHELEIYFDKKSIRKTKVNLLMDLSMFNESYQETSSGKKISKFIHQNPYLNNFLPVCPGFYSNSNTLSIYFITLTAEINSPTHTFKNLFNTLNFE